MDKKVIPYHPALTGLAREFRKNPTRAEKILWEQLKGDKLMGFDFHRQKPIGYYIVDFYCPQLLLAIELDGSVHDSEYRMLKDERRQETIEEFGVRFLRFTNDEVEKNLPAVITEIEMWIKKNKERQYHTYR
jgi:very-short-patch-repair endonuclease